MRSYFVWKGTDSRSMGIVCQAHAPLIKPEERVEHVIIPGLAGDLTEIEGEDVYNSYIQTISFSVTRTAMVEPVFRWLRGKGFVTFSSDPSRRQEARVVGAVTLDRVSRNLDHWRGQVQFYCQPLKQDLTNGYVILSAAGTVTNSGDVASRPMIIATPSSGAASLSVTVNGKTITVTNPPGTIIIDSLIQEVVNESKTAYYTDRSAGPFPILNTGSNSVSGSGWSQLQIYTRDRYL